MKTPECRGCGRVLIDGRQWVYQINVKADEVAICPACLRAEEERDARGKGGTCSRDFGRESGMGNWRDALPSQWLKAVDFEKRALLTIRRFSVENIGDDKRPVVWFDEVEKGLGLNI